MFLFSITPTSQNIPWI